jgi:hypothetical protein
MDTSMTEINTTKVEGRRTLRFESLDEIAAEVERLAAAGEPRALGNWSSGQVLQHLARAMNSSIDGFPNFVPWIVRVFLRVFMKRYFLTKPMAPGFALPPKGADLLPTATTTWDDGLRSLRAAIARQRTESPGKPHPGLGPLTREEWEQFHCRHCELHLGFLVPAAK